MTTTTAPAEHRTLTLAPLNITARYGTEKAERQFRATYQDQGNPATVKVLRNDGVDRHLSIRIPGTGMYGIDIVTWSGTLAIRSDWGNWMFSRTEDMLAFFDGHYVNMDYWSEKCVTHRQEQLHEFDEKLFRAAVLERFWDWSRRTGSDTGVVREAWETIREDLLGTWANVHDADSAIQAMYTANRSIGETVFHDPYEYRLTSYSTQLQVVFHALLWVAQNRALLAESPRATTKDNVYLVQGVRASKDVSFLLEDRAWVKADVYVSASSKKWAKLHLEANGVGHFNSSDLIPCGPWAQPLADSGLLDEDSVLYTRADHDPETDTDGHGAGPLVRERLPGDGKSYLDVVGAVTATRGFTLAAPTDHSPIDNSPTNPQEA